MNPITKLAKLLGIDRFVLIGVGVLVLVVGAGLWLGLHDRKVVRQANDAANVKVLEGKIEAIETAGAESNDRQAEFDAKQAQDKKDIDNAKATGSSPLDAMFP